MRADRQTDKQTYSSQYFAPLPPSRGGGEVTAITTLTQTLQAHKVSNDDESAREADANRHTRMSKK